MENFRQVSDNVFDTLVSPDAEANLIQEYLPVETKATNNLELNLGFHILHYSINHQTSFEPRFGMRWQFAKGRAIIAGIGLHSEPRPCLSIMRTLRMNQDKGFLQIKRWDYQRQSILWPVSNSSFKRDIRMRIEGYYQDLYNIPIVNKTTSQYSTINSAERLPDAILENAGNGYNTGNRTDNRKGFYQ